MRIVYELSQVFTPQTSSLENAEVLRALLDCLIRCDLSYLAHHKAPRLYNGKVVYGRTQEWLRIPDVIDLGYADCKSLSAWRIAELIHNRTYGNWVPKPTFRWQTRPGTTIKDFHILIQLPSGEWECPSAKLGMGNEAAHFGGNARRLFR
jgi:hypothetical protein